MATVREEIATIENILTVLKETGRNGYFGHGQILTVPHLEHMLRQLKAIAAYGQ